MKNPFRRKKAEPLIRTVSIAIIDAVDPEPDSQTPQQRHDLNSAKYEAMMEKVHYMQCRAEEEKMLGMPARPHEVSMEEEDDDASLTGSLVGAVEQAKETIHHAVQEAFDPQPDAEPWNEDDVSIVDRFLDSTMDDDARSIVSQAQDVALHVKKQVDYVVEEALDPKPDPSFGETAWCAACFG